MDSIKYNNGRIMSYFEVVGTVAMRNVKLRYKNSILGVIWSMLNPLIYLCIFIVVFYSAFDLDNYPLYALTGLIFWTFFAGTSIQVLNSFIESSGILKSLNVPPLIFPISYVLSSIINLLLSLVPFFGLMLMFGFRPSLLTFMVIPGLFFLALFVFGFSIVLATFNVYFRDVGMFYNTVLPAIFYMTPIAYPIDKVPENFQFIIKLNPMFHYISYFRDILYYNTFPSAERSVLVISIGLLFCTLGLVAFTKLKKGFISHL